jgi:intergrase/recombinase
MGLPGFEPGSFPHVADANTLREPKSKENGYFVDWGEFKDWLLKTHAKNNSFAILRWAKKYSFVLADPGRASVIHGLSRDNRRNAMAALANLSKFLGKYELWRETVKNAGLKWEKRPSVEVFLSILNTRLSDVEDWLRKAVKRLPEKYSAMLVFDVATGLRPNEACMSCHLISTLSEEGRLNEYWNKDLLMLEHFRFPEIFLRKSKNAYISFVPEEVLELVMRVKPNFPYWTLGSILKNRALPVKTIQLRKLYATRLRESGIPQEIIDLLQGRVEQSVFLRHYYKPYLNEVKEKTLKAIQPLISDILAA